MARRKATELAPDVSGLPVPPPELYYRQHPVWASVDATAAWYLAVGPGGLPDPINQVRDVRRVRAIADWARWAGLRKRVGQAGLGHALLPDWDALERLGFSRAEYYSAGRTA